MGISLILILGIATFLAVFIFHVECSVLDELEGKWKNYKNKLLTSTRRKTRMYKAALSLQPITVMTTYPLCNVNKSAFLEWFNVGLDYLVNLLVSQCYYVLRIQKQKFPSKNNLCFYKSV